MATTVLHVNAEIETNKCNKTNNSNITDELYEECPNLRPETLKTIRKTEPFKAMLTIAKCTFMTTIIFMIPLWSVRISDD